MTRSVDDAAIVLGKVGYRRQDSPFNIRRGQGCDHEPKVTSAANYLFSQPFLWQPYLWQPYLWQWRINFSFQYSVL